MTLKKKDIKIGDVVVQSNGDLGYITEIDGGYFTYYIPVKDQTVYSCLNNVNSSGAKLYKRIGEYIFDDNSRIN